MSRIARTTRHPALTPLQNSRLRARLLALTAAGALLAAASGGCVPAAGEEGGSSGKSNGLLSSSYCDDGLVCATPASGGGAMCGPCSATDPRAACDLLHTCQEGTCVACPNGPNDCGDGTYGRPCLDGGACLEPLVCVPGDVCMPPDAGTK